MADTIRLTPDRESHIRRFHTCPLMRTNEYERCATHELLWELDAVRSELAALRAKEAERG